MKTLALLMSALFMCAAVSPQHTQEQERYTQFHAPLQEILDQSQEDFNKQMDQQIKKDTEGMLITPKQICVGLMQMHMMMGMACGADYNVHSELERKACRKVHNNLGRYINARCGKKI